ncbi:uncharacterized protein GGS22DRAFT_158182 [Annulohypoxylon maeteangense]|uniref:uncharacterized protein n=1 Tax=Annulohypoxylon maeteangense TaxID=1927788 RepID=UPI0020079A20|nr:uncharacterized protein GGS22DRAFT_158182 [Annulohypoxylon maeteangense]KAI0886580.1 hypothetical protein GGS22DRAFT_158182 [Annulohypoxylon maeteangense]
MHAGLSRSRYYTSIRVMPPASTSGQPISPFSHLPGSLLSQVSILSKITSPFTRVPPGLVLFHAMEKHSQESRDPLLRHSTEESTISLGNALDNQEDGHRPIRSWLREHAFSLAIIVLLLYIAIALTVDIAMKFSIQSKEISDYHLPLMGDILRYEKRPEWFSPGSPWDQDPSEELDDAWDDLLHAINIRVTGDELDILGINKTNMVRVNGGDYIGSMGVYHHLHCLNNLRMVVHWDYYEPIYRDSPYFGHLGKAHSDHCINVLRQAVMCHANTAITTFEWVDEETSLDGKEQRLDASTTCTKWDSFDNWARQRMLIAGNYTYRPGPFERNKPKAKPHNNNVE